MESSAHTMPRIRNERSYDMTNATANSLLAKIVIPLIIAGIPAIVGLLFTMTYQNGASAQHDKNVDSSLMDIKDEIKENRLERITSYNKLYDSYDLLNHKVGELNNKVERIRR